MRKCLKGFLPLRHMAVMNNVLNGFSGLAGRRFVSSGSISSLTI